MGKGQELLDAAREGNRQIVEKILGQIAKRSGPFTSLRKGAGVNVQDDSGYTPLHHACLRGHKEIVRLLLSVDASPCIVEKNGATALHLAAWKGDSDVVSMLLCHTNPQVNVDKLTSDQESALLIAAQFGHVEVVSQLLKRGADVTIRNKKDESALDLAAQYGRLETVQLLLRARPQLVDEYRLPNCRVRVFPSTPLHLASKNGHKEVVATLIAAGIYPNVRTHNGTSLHEAVIYGKASVVSVLLRQGADLYAANRMGKTIHDLLDEYPGDATRRVRKIIRDHMKHTEYESEEDLPPFPVQDCSPTGYPNTAGMKPPETHTNYNLGLSSSSSSILTKHNHKNIVQKVIGSMGFRSIFKSAPNISNSASESDISKKSKNRSSTGTLNIANSKFFKKRDEAAVVNCDDEFENWNGRLSSRNEKINQSTRSNASCPLPYIAESTEPGDTKDSDSDSIASDLTENNNKVLNVSKTPTEAINRISTFSIFEPRDEKENNARKSNNSADSYNIVNDCYVSYDEVNKKNDRENIYKSSKPILSHVVAHEIINVEENSRSDNGASNKNSQNIPTETYAETAKPLPSVTHPSAKVPVQPSISPIIQDSSAILRTAPNVTKTVPLLPSAPILSTAPIAQPRTPVLRRAPIPAARTHIPTKPIETEKRIVYENVTPKPQIRQRPEPPKRNIVPVETNDGNDPKKSSEGAVKASDVPENTKGITGGNIAADTKNNFVSTNSSNVSVTRTASNVSEKNISQVTASTKSALSLSRASNLSSESEEDEANFEDILLSVKSKSFRHSDDRKYKISVQKSHSIDSDSSDANSALDDVDCSSEAGDHTERFRTGTLPNKKKDNTKKKVLFRHKTFSTIQVDASLIPKYLKESTETLTNYHIRGTGHCIYKAPTLQEFITMFNRDTFDKDNESLKRKSSNETAICFCKASPRKFHKSAEDLLAITVEDEGKVTINIEDLQREIDLNLSSFQCFCDTGECVYHAEKRSSQNLCVKFSVINKSISTPDITLLGTPAPTTTRPVFPNTIAPLSAASVTLENATTEVNNTVKDASLPYSTLSSTYSRPYSIKDISDGLDSLPSNKSLNQTSSGTSLQTCHSIRSSLSYTTCQENIDSSDDDSNSATDASDETVSCSETSSVRRPWVDSDSFKFGSNESVLASAIPEESEESMDGVPLLASLERLRGGGVRSGGRRRWEEAEGGSEGDALSVSSAASSCAPLHLAQHHEFNKVSPTPPKKPPRRNLSVSPTHANSPSSGYSYELRAHARSQDDLDDIQGAKHYLKHGRSVDQYVDNKLSYSEYEEYHHSPQIAPKPKPRPSLNLKNRPQPVAITTTYENVTIMEQNPKRKLRRDFENYNPKNERVRKYSAQERSSLESLLDETPSMNSPDCERFEVPRVGIPLSPTHYDQPPTPEHPPPSARQAENSIHERIRPLSQRIMEVIEEIRIRKKSQGDSV